MKRVAFIADIHLANHTVFGGNTVAGINERCRIALDVLRRACLAAAEHADVLVVCGDLFDNHKPSPQLVAEAMDALTQFPGQIELLLGNHDKASDAPGDHACAPFDYAVGCGVIEEPQWRYYHGLVGAYVPYQSGHASDWFPSAVKQAVANPQGKIRNKFLALHLGLRRSDDATPWVRAAHDAVDVHTLHSLCVEHEIEAAFAGNWHNWHRWEWGGVELVQVGTLCPTGFDNPGISGYGGVEIWPRVEGGTNRLEVPGPRFLSRIPAVKPVPGEHFFVKLQVPARDLGKAKDELEQAKVDGLIAGGTVEPIAERVDTKPLQEAMGVDFLEQAIHEYVARMDLPPQIDRDQVLATAKRYLKP